jgi:hypothetical protein
VRSPALGDIVRWVSRSPSKLVDHIEPPSALLTEDFFLPDPMSFELSGRGGVHWRDGDQFPFVQRKGTQIELRALSLSGLSRSLRTFDDALPYTIAVHEDRIAFSEVDGRGTPEATNSLTLMLGTAGNENAHPILTMRGVLESITWSPDGRPNNEVWDFQISPDGRFMAYGRSIFRGSSIWRIGLGDALAGSDW